MPKGIMKLSALGKEPPKEFVIFPAGRVQTAKGNFLFDDIASKMVMADYEQAGIRRMVDLEHLSTDPNAPNYDPDARAYFDLELRNGQLWAINVEWSPDGDNRIRTGKQRYISPAFAFDKVTKRITSLYNVAIVAIPATYDMPALVAASKRSGQPMAALSFEVKMPDEMKKICSALGLADDATVEDCLGAIKSALSAPGRKDGDKGDEGEDGLLSKLRKMLGAGDDADGEEVMSMLKKKLSAEPGLDDKKPAPAGEGDRQEDEGRNLSLLAKTSPKLYGEFMALRMNAKEVNGRLSAIENKIAKSEVETLIEKNITKIPKHMEEWAKGQSVETLSGFLKVSQFERKEPADAPKREGKDDPSKVELTGEELRVCKLSGVAPEIVLKQKKEDAQKKIDEAKMRAVS
jgi:phage I-like protein